MHQIVFGTAGHIDHGKTSLVESLTGDNTDHLPEEKKRGITIDIGFAYLNERISIIDVPGHEKFIRNMAAGAANIHYGLVVIAADDGIMPQTIEHLNILKFLGIDKGIVAITKIDLVQDKEWLELVEEDIQSLLVSIDFSTCGIYKVDNISRKGIEGLKSAMISFLDFDILLAKINTFRMNVDRVFSKTGFGTVVTGTVNGGKLKKGDDVELFPQETSAKVRTLQSHGKIVNKVEFGDRAAINLSNIKGIELKRGTIIGEPNSFFPTKYIIANINLIKDSKWILKNKQRLRFHFGTQEIFGRISFSNDIKNKMNKSFNVVIILESEVSTLIDEKFLIRSYSPVETIAGGIVLDRLFKYKFQKAKERASELPLNLKDRFFYFVKQDWENPKNLKEWIEVLQMPQEKIKSWITKDLIFDLKSGLIFSLPNEKKSKKRITKTFKYFYSKNPFRKTLSIDVFLKKLKWNESWLNYIINLLVSEKVIKEYDGGYVLNDFEIRLTDQDDRDLNNIKSLLKSFKNKPFLSKDIISKFGLKPKRVSDLLFLLRNEGEIEFIGQDFWLDKNSLNKVISDVKSHFNLKKELSVNKFKSITGLSRKTAIPLLEYFDSKKLTLRSNNMRLKGEKLI